MSDPSKVLSYGTHPNKKGVCSRCGATVTYGQRQEHWNKECWKMQDARREANK
jgi:hypothetical protein